MKLSGSYNLNVKKEVVWKALNNPEILKKCIPGCESFDKKDSTTFNTTATNQIGPMNSTFSGTVKLTNIKENESYTLAGEGNSSVGFAKGNAEVKLNETNGMTTLTYEVHLHVGGKIAQLGSRLIDGVAKKMANYFFGRFADLVSPIKKNGKSETKNVEKRVVELKSNFLNKYIYYFGLFFFLLIVAKIFFF